MILENGTIRTLDPSLPLARALAIAGDRIAGGIGTHETALASPEVVDLRGRCVLPGFTDAHVHFLQWALAQDQVRLEDATSRDDAVARVAQAVRETPPGGWVRGTGWRDAAWTPAAEPTKNALDEVSADTPVALMAKDGHSLWLNSAALARADGDLQVPGGVVETNERGEPSGVLREESAWRFRNGVVLAAVTDEEALGAMRVGLEHCAERGVVAVHDKDGWLGILPRWQRLQAEQGLTLRVWQSLPHTSLEELERLRLRAGLGDRYLRAGYLKAFMDGTLGSQTARLLDGSGIEITSGAELEEIIRRGARIGWPVSVHAIGDRANRDALDAFEATRGEWEQGGLRPRVEHAQCVSPDDLARFAQLGVAVSVQFSHAPSDRDLAERFWADRLDAAYAFRSLADSGAVVANGSDAPIEELDPWWGICAGVRRTIDDRPAWRSEEAVTLEQALQATCVAPAWLSGDEHVRGRLVPGLLADLVVLDRDPIGLEPEELPEVHVVATMVGGRWVHNPPPWD
ncbi:MAG TPA: amidohydrolase [Gaiellaceae bacterium]|jgi:hypothetical protein